MKKYKGSIIQREVDGVFGIVAKHTGIVTEKGTVIHYNDEKEVVEEVDFCSFSKGKKVEIRKSPLSETHANKIVNKARKIMKNKNNSYNGKYNFLFNNCQDFTQDVFND